MDASVGAALFPAIEIDLLLFQALETLSFERSSRTVARGGHKTRNVFDRYNITSKRDLADAVKKIEISQNKLKWLRLTKTHSPCKMKPFNEVENFPEWRNWQTRWTQNPVVLSTVWVRPPPPGPLHSSPWCESRKKPNSEAT
jgi:hypothetical protein